MTTHLCDDYEPDYLTEARRFCEDYRAWLMQMPADRYNAGIEEFQAELARREQAVDDALERKYREQLEAAQKRNACPHPADKVVLDRTGGMSFSGGESDNSIREHLVCTQCGETLPDNDDDRDPEESEYDYLYQAIHDIGGGLID